MLKISSAVCGWLCWSQLFGALFTCVICGEAPAADIEEAGIQEGKIAVKGSITPAIVAWLSSLERNGRVCVTCMRHSCVVA
jgi:hypothetical protein